VIGGVEQLVKVAHFRLSYSRQMFVIAYPRETQEMVLDAHNQAFVFFGGVPKRMVYDYVPGNIIIVMWRKPLCAPELPSPCQTWQTK
jgi:transposase